MKPKARATDFTEEDLPANRKEVFQSCFREHFSLLVKLAVLLFVSLLPALILWMVRQLQIHAQIAALSNPDEEMKAAVFFRTNLLFGWSEVVAIVLFGIALAGITAILKRVLWDLPVFFWDDFRKGIKSNGLSFALLFFILGLLTYFLRLMNDSLLQYIAEGLLIFILCPVFFWLMLNRIYYDLSVLQRFENALLFTLKTLPVTLLLSFLTFAPVVAALQLIPLLLVAALVLAFYGSVLLLPLILVWMLYANHVFDRYINREYHPEIYRKGMRKED